MKYIAKINYKKNGKIIFIKNQEYKVKRSYAVNLFVFECELETVNGLHIDRWFFTGKEDLNDIFYTPQEIRKQKLNKLNESNLL